VRGVSRDPLALLVILAGLLWLLGPPWMAAFLPWRDRLAVVVIGGLIGLVPGLLLVSGGLAWQQWIEPRRALRLVALGGLLGGLAAPFQFFLLPWPLALADGLTALLCFLLAGASARRFLRREASLPPAPRGLRAAARVALDQSLMAYFTGVARLPRRRDAAALAKRMEMIETALADRAVVEALVAAPPVPEAVQGSEREAAGYRHQVIRFVSGFEPPAALGPAPAWLNAESNRMCTAWVFRQAQAGRPWLIGLHGYRMGRSWMDLRLFPPRLLFERLGWNLVVPVLPLHGPRAIRGRSGDDYLDGDPLELLFAQAQTLWDLRRTVAWIRSREPDARIGVLGYSLGGQNAALLASHERDLDLVVAGIPVADLASLLWDNLPAPHAEALLDAGIDVERFRRFLNCVAPLALTPQVPMSRRAVFAGLLDEVVAPSHPLALGRHWGVAVDWFPGGHLTFRGHRAPVDALSRVARDAGWISK
jgi:hypothetical protein